jgi:hypothetical protein
MAAIVAILILGVNNKTKAPVDIKNMKNEKGKVNAIFE